MEFPLHILKIWSENSEKLMITVTLKHFKIVFSLVWFNAARTAWLQNTATVSERTCVVCRPQSSSHFSQDLSSFFTIFVAVISPFPMLWTIKYHFLWYLWIEWNHININIEYALSGVFSLLLFRSSTIKHKNILYI